LRAAYRARTAARPTTSEGATVVAVRALSDYDVLFNLDPPPGAAIASVVALPVAG